MAFSAAIFDLDGTILDSMPIWSNLAQRFLSTHGIDQEFDLDGKLGVISMHNALEYLIREFKLDLDLETAYRQTWQIVENFYRQKAELKPGIKNILAALKANGIPCGIITATESRLVTQALERAGIADDFEYIISCADTQTSKRTPEVFFTMTEKLRSLPEKTLVFEDALYAGRTAKKAGFSLAAVYDPSEKNPAELAEIADIYCRSWEEFPLDEL